MGLLVTLYLITFNVYVSTSSNIAPPNRGFSYIEVWMFGILVTISFAILEYFFILAYIRKNSHANSISMIRRIDLGSLIFNLNFFTSFLIFYWIKGLYFLWVILLLIQRTNNKKYGKIYIVYILFVFSSHFDGKIHV